MTIFLTLGVKNSKTLNSNQDDLKMLTKIQEQLESLKNDMNSMILTDQNGVSDELSHYTPIKLRQEKFFLKLSTN